MILKLLLSILLCGITMTQKIFAYERKVMVVGHRGAAGYVLENTLHSFERAIQMGVDMVELDVHLCASGELVVFHDHTVERISNGHGSVAQKTLGELKQLDLVDGQKISTLGEVLDCIDRRVKINIELKGADVALAVSDLVKYYVEKRGWSYDDFFVSSFDHHELLFFKLECPMVSVGALLYGLPILLTQFVEPVGAHVAVLELHYTNAAIVDDAHSRGKQVYVYTVNAIEDIVAMLNFGVDGIISDYPDRVQMGIQLCGINTGNAQV